MQSGHRRRECACNDQVPMNIWRLCITGFILSSLTPLHGYHRLLGFGQERFDEILSLEEMAARRTEAKRRMETKVAALLAEQQRKDPLNLPGDGV